jgi:small-conductance mechanosensitive channel
LVEKNFRNNNIRIPYPQREIHVKDKSSLEWPLKFGRKSAKTTN